MNDGAAAYGHVHGAPQRSPELDAPECAPPLGWGLNVAHDTGYEYRSGTFDDESVLGTRFNPYRFGDSDARIDLVPAAGRPEPGDRRGRVRGLGGSLRLAPRSPWRRRPDAGRLRPSSLPGVASTTKALHDPPEPERRHSAAREPVVHRLDAAAASVDADELELRMFAGSNYGPVVSTLERTLNDPWDYQANFASVDPGGAEGESVENHLDFFDGLAPCASRARSPTGGDVAIGDQLSAAQLLGDHSVGLDDGTADYENADLRPLHQRLTLGDGGSTTSTSTTPSADAFVPIRRIRRHFRTTCQPHRLRRPARKLDLSPWRSPLTRRESILHRFFPPFFVRLASRRS